MEEKPKYVEQNIGFVERRREYGDVYTYVFLPEEPVIYTAGQYCHIRVSGMPDDVRSVREYSFATAPHEEHIEFGIDFRSKSDFQKRLEALQAGDTVGLFKIKSHMTWPPATQDVVMVAGGVGITPFRSMLRDRKEKDILLRSTIIHASGNGYLYADEILALSDMYIQTGRERFLDDVGYAADTYPNAHYYVAGSPGFVAQTLEFLRNKGISAQSDPFKGLEEI